MEKDWEKETFVDSIVFTPLKEKVPKIGVRHVQAVLLFFYLAVTMLTRSTMSLAVVAMTDNTTSSNPDITTYDWNNTNIMLSSFYWTYIIFQGFSGYVFKVFGLRRLLLITMFLNSIIFAVIPFAAECFGSFGVMGCRMLQGLCQGFTYPACHATIGLWAPVKERSKLSVLIYAGGNTGVMLAMLITGYISSSQYGWPVVFYLFGSVGVTWCICWYLLGFDSPMKHPRIGHAERTYIMTSLDHREENEKEKESLPLKAIFSSVPYWALVAANVGTTWCMTITDLEVPTYLNRVLGFAINSNGVISASPQIIQLAISVLIAPLSDYVVHKNIVSLMNCRRICQCLGNIVPAIAVVWLAFLTKSQASLAVILLNIIIGANVFLLCGSYVNHVDLSPKYAGLMLGIENTMSQAVGMTAPIFVQFMVTDMADIYLWRYVFLPLAATLIVSTLIFVAFGSADVQWWNSGKIKSDEKAKDPINDINKTNKV